LDLFELPTNLPATEFKLAGGCGTSLAHMLAMAHDDPTIWARPWLRMRLKLGRSERDVN
jgi:hypothetical protein